jgi:transposase
LSVRNLQRDPNAEFERLEALNVYLLTPQARSAFLQRAQEAASLLAMILVGKFGDHLPLNRQSAAFAREGRPGTAKLRPERASIKPPG